MRPADTFYEALSPETVYDTKATVMAKRGNRVNVELFSGERLREVELIGNAAAGDLIRLRYVSGRYVALGPRAGGEGTGGTSIIQTGGSGSSGGSGTVALTPANIPWALNKQGDTITGHIAVAPNITIDGYDISATFATIQAQLINIASEPILVFAPSTALTNERVLQIAGLGFSPPTDAGPGNALTYTLISSSNPGANPSILASNPGGGLTLQRLGVGSPDVAGYMISSTINAPSYLRGAFRTGNDVGGAQFYSESNILPQFRIAHGPGTYGDFTISSTGSMTFFTTGPDPSAAHIYIVTAGGLSIGGGQPLAKLHAFSQTLDHVRFAWDGDNYATGRTDDTGDFTLATFGSTGHLFFEPLGGVGIGMGGAAPGALFESRSMSRSQTRWSYDGNNWGEVQVTGGGNATLRTSGSSLILDLQPTGGLAGQKFLLPANSYDINIGSPFKKFLTVNAAELQVETLVTFDVQATIGGRILTIVSSPLATDVASTATGANNFPLKYNDVSIGDIVRMEARGKVEWMTVAGGPTGSGPYLYTFNRNVDGTGANDWVAGDVVANTGQTGTGWIDQYALQSSKGTPIEFIYNKDGATFSGNLNQTTVWKLWGDATSPQAGDIVYYGMGGGMWNRINHYLTDSSPATFSGALEYWNGIAWVTLVGATATLYNPTTGVTTSVGVGALPTSTGQLVIDWSATGQPGWAKTAINGQSAYWVRWRVVANTSGFATNGVHKVIKGSAQYGPTIVGVVRRSNIFNDFDARWAGGNLHGWYDYGRTAYGFAAGNSTATWLSIDDLNGFRLMFGSTRRGWWDTAGNIELGYPVRARFAADGSGYVSGGNITWDTQGNASMTGSLTVTGGDLRIGNNIAYNSTLSIDTNADGVPDGWGIYNNAGGANPVTPSIQATGGADGGAFYRLSWAVANSSTKGLYALAGTIKGGFKPGGTYVVSWYARATGSNVGQTMGLYWNTAPTVQTNLSNLGLSTSWQRYAVKITWGASVDPNLYISILWGGGTSGTLDIDQIQVEEGPAQTYWKPSADELLPGSITANMINVQSLSAIKADLGTIYAGDIRLGNQDANTFNLATFTGLRLFKSGSVAQLVGYNAGVAQSYFDTDGKIKAGAGNVVLDSTGIAVLVADAYDPQYSFKTRYNNLTIGDYYSSVNIAGAETRLISNALAGANNYLNLFSGGNSTDQSTVYIAAGWLANSSSMVNQSATITLQSKVGIGHNISYYAPSGHLFTGPIRVRESSGRSTPISAGLITEDYIPSSTKWTNNDASFANITLNGANTTSIAFHDSGARVDAIVAGAGVITLGQDIGWGTARTDFAGAVGTTWTVLTLATNWSNLGTGYAPLSYKRVGDLVYVRGLVQRTTTNANPQDVIATLPAGFRPAYRAVKVIPGNTGSGAASIRLDIATNGQIFCNDVGITTNAANFLAIEFWISTVS